MAITGGIKFFEKSKSLFADGVTGSASSGTGAENSALDQNPLTYWRSVGSDDTTTETFIVTFPSTVTIDRILLVDMNFKEFTVKYDLLGTYTDFTNVVGLDGALGGGISETAFSDDVAYYEFDSVSTTMLEITCTKTQTVDAQKFISQIIATTEIATLQGYPDSRVEYNRNERQKRTLSGRFSVQKSQETFGFRLRFSSYPTYSSTYTSDLDAMFTLFDSEDPFLVWLCGGRRGATYFRYTLRGYRLKDIFQVQTSGKLRGQYKSGVYVNPVDLNPKFVEAV